MGLRALDLSSNNISSVDFTSLEQLQTLDLSGNAVESLAALQLPSSLKTLRLQNNKINYTGQLDDIKSLPLEALYFQDRDHGRRNALCDHPSYAITVMRMFPSLKILDGEHLALKNSTLESALDAIEAPASPLELPHSEPWLATFDWGPEPFQTTAREDALAVSTQERLAACERLCEEADEVFASMED